MAVFALQGVVPAMLIMRLPDLQLRADLSEAGLGLVPMGGSIGALASFAVATCLLEALDCPTLPTCRPGRLRTAGETMTRKTKSQKPRVPIYTRFSSDLQRDAYKEDQARKQDYEIVEVYSDRAMSGASLLRPGLQALLRDAGAGLVDLVQAEALDRFSRIQADIASLFGKLRFWGVRVETVAEGVITEMHIGLRGTINVLFLKDLAQKTHRRLEGRVRDGKSAGARACGCR